MTATRKPLLTRRRVIAAVVLLVLGLAMAEMLEPFDSDTKAQLETRFVRFDHGTNGYYTRAVVSLKNISGKLYGDLGKNWTGVVWCHFSKQNASGEYLAMNTEYGTNTFVLRPHSMLEATTTLPEDGSTGHVVLIVLARKSRLPFLARARAMLHLKQPFLSGEIPVEMWVECDEEIQCPRGLRDGTVEPAHLLPAPEKKR